MTPERDPTADRDPWAVGCAAVVLFAGFLFVWRLVAW